MKCAIKASMLAFGTALHRGYKVIHITVNMGEALVCVFVCGEGGGGAVAGILVMAP